MAARWLVLYLLCGFLGLPAIVYGDLGAVNVGVRRELVRCLRGLDSANVQQGLTEPLRCVTASLFRCSLHHAPRHRKHVHMAAFCGVINSGTARLRAATWRITVMRQFGLYLQVLHFRLPSSPRCKYGARLNINFSYKYQQIQQWKSYTYCGYRKPWDMGLVSNAATVESTDSNDVAIPHGYFFVLTYFAFDVTAQSVSLQNLIEEEAAKKTKDNFKMFVINIGEHYASLRVELQYLLQVRFMNRLGVRFKSSLSVEVFDGPGPLSPLALDGPRKSNGTGTSYYKLASSYLCFVKAVFLSKHSVQDTYMRLNSRAMFSLTWESVSYKAVPVCDSDDNVKLHRFGPCVIVDAFKNLVIKEMMFSGYNSMLHQPSTSLCQYGGLYIILQNPVSRVSYEYARVCSNIRSRSVLPYADYDEQFSLPRHRGYVLFITFPGYSEGHIDIAITHNPPNPQHVTTNLVMRKAGPRKDDYESVIKDSPLHTADRQTTVANVWLVNELHRKPPTPFHSGSLYMTAFGAISKEFFPSGPFKLIAASSFTLTPDLPLTVIIGNIAGYDGDTYDNKPLPLPFKGAEYEFKESVKIRFNLSYSGYDQFPMFALNIKIIQESYYLCVPATGYGVHQRAEAAISVQVPLAWPAEQFAGTELWWNYRSGGCRALFVDRRSECVAGQSTQLAEIHYKAHPRLSMAFEVDVSVRKTAGCSPHCALHLAVWEWEGMAGRSRYHEWRGVWRVTWQVVAADFRRVAVHVNMSCGGCRCDVAAAVRLPLTTNIAHATTPTTYLKYVEYVRENFKDLFNIFGLNKMLRPENAGRIDPSEYRLGSWHDAQEYCSARNASLFTPTRTLHGRLWDLIHSQHLNLGWQDKEYFFAGMHYDVDASMWRMTDGSPVTYIDWGLTHRLPSTGTVSCTDCSPARNSHRLASTVDADSEADAYSGALSYADFASDTDADADVDADADAGSQLQCAAFEASADLSHVRALRVNCSALVWSRVLCDHTNPGPPSAQNTGEFLTQNNILMQSKYRCPDGYPFRLADKCMKLTLVEQYNFRRGRAVVMCNKTETEQRCTDMNGTLLGSENLQSSIVFDGQTKSSVYHLILDILDEFFAEGSDMYCNGDVDGEWLKYGSAGFMEHPPSHPSYIPCFTAPMPTEPWQRDVPVSLFSCNDGSMIPAVLICDGKHDCPYGEDELQCSHNACNLFEYRCQSGGACVHYDHVCDDVPHCPDGGDESFCHSIRVFPAFSVEALSVHGLCDPPSGDFLMCRTTHQCYPSSAICHYDHSDGILAYCKDGSQMGWGSLCEYADCQGHYKCGGAYCIPVRKVCDGVMDCPLGDDERECGRYECPGHMRCSGVSYCIAANEICDGVAHCPLQDDEKYCQECPLHCTCSGTAIHCTDEFPTSSLHQSPSALVLYNVTSVIDVIHSTKVDYTRLLDVKYTNIGGKFEILKVLNSVNWLFLNHLGITSLPEYFINGYNINYANFSHNYIKSIARFAFADVRNIRVLSLAWNSLESLEWYFCEELEFLTALYLTNNPLLNVAPRLFLENPSLALIRSSWYIVCCVASRVGDCLPQTQFVSSCSNLLASLPQRLVISSEAVAILLGNVAGIVAQALNHEASKVVYVNLAVADGMMGVFLLAIAAVDLSHRGHFFALVQTWPTDVLCLLLGLANFTSSQVSLLILCILSVARTLSVQKIGGLAAIKPQLWKACGVAWVVPLGAGAAYTLFLLSRGQGAHNNLCITVGVAAHYRHLSAMDIAFHLLFIAFNLLLLLVILASMLIMFRLVAQSSRAVGRTEHKMLMHLRWRLLLLLTCNVVSWLPLLVLSVLLLVGGVPGKHEERIVQWVAILGVPICALTDPLLYSSAPLKAALRNKWRKSRSNVKQAKLSKIE